jgi:hypothetical protein
VRAGSTLLLTDPGNRIGDGGYDRLVLALVATEVSPPQTTRIDVASFGDAEIIIDVDDNGGLAITVPDSLPSLELLVVGSALPSGTILVNGVPASIRRIAGLAIWSPASCALLNSLRNTTNTNNVWTIIVSRHRPTDEAYIVRQGPIGKELGLGIGVLGAGAAWMAFAEHLTARQLHKGIVAGALAILASWTKEQPTVLVDAALAAPSSSAGTLLI